MTVFLEGLVGTVYFSTTQYAMIVGGSLVGASMMPLGIIAWLSASGIFVMIAVMVMLGYCAFALGPAAAAGLFNATGNVTELFLNATPGILANVTEPASVDVVVSYMFFAPSQVRPLLSAATFVRRIIASSLLKYKHTHMHTRARASTCTRTQLTPPHTHT